MSCSYPTRHIQALKRMRILDLMEEPIYGVNAGKLLGLCEVLTSQFDSIFSLRFHRPVCMVLDTQLEPSICYPLADWFALRGTLIHSVRLPCCTSFEACVQMQERRCR